MKLYCSPSSPFVRKIVMAAMELGLSDQITMEQVATTPVNSDPKLHDVSPLRKIPALVLDDGSMMVDSRAITEYLDWCAGGERLLPLPGAARWPVKRTESLAEGLLDAAVLMRYETFLRPEEKQWKDWIDSQTTKIAGALSALEVDAATFGDRVDAATIATCCACGYLDFRFDHLGWRDAHPVLAAWYKGFSERPSAQATVPRN